VFRRRLCPDQIGFWVWVLHQKPKNIYTQTQNLNPKAKNIYIQTQTQKLLYPNPKPKNCYTQTQNPKIVIPKLKTQKYL